MALTYLENEMGKFPQQAETYQLLADLWKKSLWFQLAEKLSELCVTPFFSQGTQFLNLYDGFVSKFGRHLTPLSLANLAIAAANQKQDAPSAIGFLEEVQKGVNEEQAVTMLKLEIARFTQRAGNLEGCKALLDEGKTALDVFPGIMHQSIQSKYYHASLEYFKVKGPPSDYFKSSILFLTYTSLDSLPVDEQILFASDVGVAALLGHNIFNFGELLQHPIIQVLNGTPFEWLGHLLFAFNAGDIKKAEDLIPAMQRAKPEVTDEQVAFLHQKIRIMALIEMVFQRDSHDRTIAFQQIAQACDVKADDVEILVMKAFSVKVVKGIIDQVDGTVRVSWVQPRVLDMAQVRTLRDRLKEWTKQVDAQSAFLEDNAAELLK